MERTPAELRRSAREKGLAAVVEEEIDFDGEEEEEEEEETEERRVRPTPPSRQTSPVTAAARGRAAGGGPAYPICQAEKCTADLTEAKRYHRRHKVCEPHSKSAVVIVAGLRQRFCQQCSRFHELSEFDEAKRSCRRRLAGHNERRRKSSSESQGEGSSHCIQENQGTKMQIGLPGNQNYKHFPIR